MTMSVVVDAAATDIAATAETGTGAASGTGLSGGSGTRSTIAGTGPEAAAKNVIELEIEVETARGIVTKAGTAKGLEIEVETVKGLVSTAKTAKGRVSIAETAHGRVSKAGTGKNPGIGAETAAGPMIGIGAQDAAPSRSSMAGGWVEVCTVYLKLLRTLIVTGGHL